MNKTQLIAAVAESRGLTKTAAESALNGIIDTIQKEVAKGGAVIIPGFAKFDSATRPERHGKNPLNGQPYHTASKRVPVIKAGTLFKSLLL